MPVKQVAKGSAGKKVTTCVKDQEQQGASVSSEQSEEVIHQIPSARFDIFYFKCVHIGTEMPLFNHSQPISQ